MKRYVLYDYLQVAGGAERLVIELAGGMPGYQLVVSRIYPQAELLGPAEMLGANELISLGTPISRWLLRVPEAIFNFACRASFLRDAEAVVYSGLYAPLAVHWQKTGRRVYYCHTPPRFAYDWKERYLARAPRLLRPLATMMIGVFQSRYERSVARMDVVIANSENVRQRLQRYLGIEAVVVAPPVDTDKFAWLGQGDYFLSVARLEPYKRVEMIVAAFRRMPDQKLVIASGGSEEATLKKLSEGASNIVFVGWQTESQLQGLVGRARAAIYMPQDEDFGMSPVEAMSAGKPVIGVSEGGLLETVVHGQTGLLIARDGGCDALVDAVGLMTSAKALAMREACEARAHQFSKRVFLDRMNAILEN